jgi:hypothetical protein
MFLSLNMEVSCKFSHPILWLFQFQINGSKP